MAYSTGTRTFLSEALSWSAAAVMIAFSIANFDYLKHLAADMTGMKPQTAQADAASKGQAAQTATAIGGVVELKAGRNGHFVTEAEINGRAIEVLVDTGATTVAMSYEDAERAGIFLKESDFTQRANTANGVAKVAPVTIDRISIGDITVRDIQAGVMEPGRLNGTLLGMSFLSRLSKFEMRKGVLVLHD